MKVSLSASSSRMYRLKHPFEMYSHVCVCVVFVIEFLIVEIVVLYFFFYIFSYISFFYIILVDTRSHL